MELLADGVAMVQSSLRDEIAWRDCQPWVETHGYHRRSLRDPKRPAVALRTRQGHFVGGPWRRTT